VHYPRLDDIAARGYVDQLFQKPPVSVMQLMQHIDKHKDAPAAVAALDEMHAVPEKPEEPAPEPPKGWIVDWLKDDEDLQGYAANFLGEKVATKDDLLADPPLDCAALKEIIGINKLGHQKKLLAKIERLRQE